MSTVDSLIGTTLAGRYRVEARVGSGAMGAVYRAKQAGLGRSVALKIVNRDRQVDSATAQRFRREAKALSALHHPNTVRVFDFGATTGGLLYLAMELLEGEPLTDCLLRNGPLPLPQAITITQQVLRSIGEAHACGIVHRDLKPDNIFLARVQASPAPIVKVLDFGIAKAIDGTSKIDQFETLDGTVFGTPRYMSPEQAAGRALDPRSDLYSVGIMLYELISGHPPFVDNDAVVVMARHIRDKPAPLSKAAGTQQIPLSLEAVVHKALAKQASARFQSAEEFERALAKCATEIARQAKSPLARFVRDQSRLALGAAAALALAAGGGGLLYALRRAPVAAERADVPQPTAAAGTTTVSAVADHAPATPEASPLPPPLPEAAAPAEAARSVVSLQTSPPAAAVLQGGSPLGVTPLDVSMNRGSSLTLLLRKKGFAEHRLELRADDRARIVTLRRLDEHDRDKERPSYSWRGRRERSKKASPPAAASTTTSAAPATPSANPSAPGSGPGADKGSPYERF